MPKPLVTICIPLHNYREYITEAIQSVQSQTLNNFECFIVNDSSTDDSEAVALEAIKNDKRFHVLNVNFRNLSATRNYGLKQGTAPFVCCLDADDRMGSPDFLEILVSALEQDWDIGIAYTGITVMDAQGKLGHLNAWPTEYDVDKQTNRMNQIPSLCVFRRVAWERAGGYRPWFHHAEDAEFWLNCVGLGFKAKQITKAGLFHYRLHNKSASRVHRTGEIPEPDWTEFYPWTKDQQRPFAADGKPPKGSWPVRFYDKPEVSIIVPVGKGHEEAVKDALHSVEGQTFRMWECIIVNDTGDTLDLTGFPWARVYDGISNGIGAGAARNRGASIAKAPFIVFLDADDLLKPRFLEATLEAYKQHGKYAYTDWLTRDDKMVYTTHETLPYSLDNFRQHPSIHPITTLLPRKWFEAVGGFDESMPAFEDVDFYLKFMVKGFCGIRVSEPLLIYNLNTGTRREFGKQTEDRFKALLRTRYGATMEAMKMCNCVEPPKGKQPLAPSQDNLSAYKDAYGDALMCELVWERAGVGASSFFGPATRVYYGRRARHDVFLVWEQDILNSEGVFKPLNNYTTEPEVTVIPEPPPVVTTPVENVVIQSEVVLPAGDYPIAETDASPDSEPVYIRDKATGDWNEIARVQDTSIVIATIETKDEPVSIKAVKPRGKPGRKAKTK